MNFSPSFKHEDTIFSYRFFGQKSRTSARFSIEGMHLFAFTATPLTITEKEFALGRHDREKLPGRNGGGAFLRRFSIACEEPLVLKAFSESAPLQKLVTGLFSNNLHSIEIREEVITATFKAPLRGRVKGQTGRICTDNPVDAEWAKSLRLSLLKLGKVITKTTALARDMKPGGKQARPGLVFASFFAAAGVFIITAFFVTQYWAQ